MFLLIALYFAKLISIVYLINSAGTIEMKKLTPSKPPSETFWGGSYPIPYSGQSLKTYGRYGIATYDNNPTILYNPYAYPVNP